MLGELPLDDGTTARVALRGRWLSLELLSGTHIVVATATGAAYPSAPLALRRDGVWDSPAGEPLLRAMALCFPNLPEVHQDWVQYQYLYGPDLLVAPVYSSSATRQVLLPDGEWVDFFTGQRYAGPSIQRVTAPLETIPVFVRAARVGTPLPDSA